MNGCIILRLSACCLNCVEPLSVDAFAVGLCGESAFKEGKSDRRNIRHFTLLVFSGQRACNTESILQIRPSVDSHAAHLPSSVFQQVAPSELGTRTLAMPDSEMLGLVFERSEKKQKQQEHARDKREKRVIVGKFNGLNFRTLKRQTSPTPLTDNSECRAPNLACSSVLDCPPRSHPTTTPRLHPSKRPRTP